jgi:putative hydrolase of the HAD superfamily
LWWPGRTKEKVPGTFLTKAVFFDVDFTLIYPGPKFQGEGYRQFCEKHGMAVNPARFGEAVLSASHILDQAQDNVYNHQIFIDYTAHIIERMGGRGPAVVECAAEIYQEWAVSRHFLMYEDVPAGLKALAERNLTIGLISNSHRCLESFQSHFELEGLIDVAISSSQHGYMKPHPSIFEAALTIGGVTAAQSVMVGDSLSQDIEGARRVGMRGVLVRRSDSVSPAESTEVPVIKSLTELPRLLGLEP